MRKTHIGAAIGTTALLSSLAAPYAWADTTTQTICSTYQNNVIAFDAAVSADPTVKTADLAYQAAVTAVTRATIAERAALKALTKARAAHKSAPIHKAQLAYNKAHAARLAAVAQLPAVKARADYVRAVAWARFQTVVDASCLTPPTNLAVNVGNADVALTWQGQTNLAGYHIYRNGVLIATVTSATFNFDDSTVHNGLTYTYLVRGFVSSGVESGDSNIVVASPMLPAPTGLVATAGDSQVALSWNGVSGATGYQIFRNGTQIGSTTTRTTYTDTNALNGTTYSYTVRTVSSGTTSTDSAAASATPTGSAVTLSTPTNVVATGAANAVSVTWSAVPNATGYTVYRNGSVLGTTTTTTYNDTTAAIGTQYSYTVVATRGNVSSPTSAASTASALPAAPTNFAAVASSGQVGLSWNAVAGATSYQVWRNGAQLATVAAGTTSYNDSAVTNGTSYTYTVRTVVGSAVSLDSSSQTVTPQNAAAPLTAPTGLAATQTTNLNTGGFELTWTAVSGAASYTIYSDGVQAGTASTNTWIPATAPALSTSHSYTVMANGATAALNSPQSSPVAAAVYQGAGATDGSGRTVYGTIQVSIVVTSGTTKSITGCWATYPTNSDSGSINPRAIPQLCSQALSKQPTSANATTTITAVSGASYTSPAFATSLQNALTLAGM